MKFCDKCKGGLDPRVIHVCLPMTPVYVNVEERIHEAIKIEREECARLVEGARIPCFDLHLRWLAHKIRTRET